MANKITIPSQAVRFPCLTEANEQMRMYIRKDLEAAEQLRKRFDVEQAIAEGLRMQRLGRAVKPGKPTLIALHVFHVIENWSHYK